MSKTDAELNRDLGDADRVFERLSQVLCHELACSAVPGAQVVDSQIYDRNYDGGCDAAAWTSSGHHVAIEAKAWQKFDDETNSIVGSFDKLLKTPQHSTVTHYLWCSTFKPNVTGARGRTVGSTIDTLKQMAGARDIQIKFVGIGDIRKLLQHNLPDLDQLYFGQDMVPGRDIRDHTAGALGALLDRVDGPGDTALHFDSNLAGVLETFTSTRSDKPLDITRLRQLLTELDARIIECGDKPPVLVELPPVLQAAAESIGSQDVREFDAVAVGKVRNVLAQCAETMRDRHHHLLTKPDGPNEFAARAIEPVLISALAIRDELQLLVSMAHATKSQVLLVSGQWGTGKTYHLAKHVAGLAAEGQTSLLLRAKQFAKPDAPILRQSWRDGLVSPRITSDAVLAILDTLAPDEGVCVLAIDGLNEWPNQTDVTGQLHLLMERLARFRHVKVIVTLRSYRSSPLLGVAEYRHSGPDRTHLARALAQHLQAPIVPYWNGALLNPLTARIAAKVYGAHPEHPRSLLSPVSFSDLAQQWVRLLADEYARARPHGSAAAVIELVDALGKCGGRATRTQLREATGGTEHTHAIIDYLIDNGCFEDTGTDITFRWQRMAELTRARQLVRSRKYCAQKELNKMSPDERDTYLGLLADECPLRDQPTELPRWLAGYDADLLEYFVVSLQARASDRYNETTLQLAASALRSPKLAPGVCYAALTNPLGSARSVSPGWLAQELVAMKPRTRSRIWPHALEGCLRDEEWARVLRNDDYADVMSSVVTWIATDSHHWSLTQRSGIARLLIWFSWIETRIFNSPYEYAVRQLVELLHGSPEIAEALCTDCRYVGDEYLAETITAAAVGVLLRWPDDPHSARTADLIAAAVRSVRPQMFRTLEHLFRIEHRLQNRCTPTDLRIFLREATDFRRLSTIDRLASWTRAPTGLQDGPDIDSADRDLVREYAAIQRALIGADGKHCTPRKTDDILNQRWLSWQWARADARDIPRLEEIEEIDPQLAAGFATMFVQRDTRQYPDPTVPVSINIDYSDEVRQHWWVVSADAAALPDITVTDPAGDRWIVLDGRFRWLTPQHLDVRERIWLTRSIPGPRPCQDDGMAPPGRHGSDVVQLHTTFNGAPTSQEDPESVDEDSDDGTDPGGFLFADWAQACAEVEIPWNAADMDAYDAPNPALVALLGAQWSGNYLDYVREGALMITDPALSLGSGPRALLVRAGPFLDALRTHHIAATVTVTVADPRDHMFSWRLDDKRTICINEATP